MDFLQEATNNRIGSYYGYYTNSISSLYNTVKLSGSKTEVEHVRVAVPNKVVIVTFTDGSKQKVVCDDEDTFSMEAALEKAIFKNLVGGTKEYNKLVKNALKVYDKQCKAEELAKQEEERIARKKMKNKEKRERSKARKKEEQIEMMAEAIRRANKTN